MKLTRTLIFSTLFSLCMTGCIRYSFSGSSLPAHIKSVAIPLFDNQTAKAGVEETLRDKLYQAFQASGVAEVKRSGGDAELRITLLEYRHEPGEYDLAGNVKTYRVVLTTQVSFVDSREEKPLYEEKVAAVGAYNYGTESEETGLSIAMAKLTEIILNNTIRGF